MKIAVVIINWRVHRSLSFRNYRRKKISDRQPRSRYLLEYSSYRPAVKRVIVALLKVKLNPIAETTRSNTMGETLIIARLKKIAPYMGSKKVPAQIENMKTLLFLEKGNFNPLFVLSFFQFNYIDVTLLRYFCCKRWWIEEKNDCMASVLKSPEVEAGEKQ